MPAAQPGLWLPEGTHKVDLSEKDHGHVAPQLGRWFETAPEGVEEVVARNNLGLIRSRCEELYNSRAITENKWTNDPMVFPMPEGISGIQPFPPNDQQYYICGIYDPERSYLTHSAKPGHDLYTDGSKEFNSAWVRLCDFSRHDGQVNLFQERGQKGYHMGRVMPGSLDNGYFVEALNAVTLRPKLVQNLFYCYDEAKSIYIARLFKHGQWWRLELDDYIPVSPPPEEHHENHGPICCTSEHFPHVLWPSLIEKAYAKLYTKRMSIIGDDPEDLGGWESIGAGGRVEDALVMLTGGVAGRFRTREVSADRLFIYLFEHQMDTLFVCRVNQAACELYGVKLNPYYSYSVNRAVTWEGRLYVQVFCAAPKCFDGGLQDLSVPYTLLQCPDYPEHEAEGFFWCDVNDFHLYFDTIFECHLTNTPPSAIPGMPPYRFPMPQQISSPQGPQRRQGEMPAYCGQVHCHDGPISKHNAPEFEIRISEGMDVECEVVCSFDQYDQRRMMDSPECEAPADILLKAYVKIGETFANKRPLDVWHYVCKSNWLPINHSMVAFHCRGACRIKVVAEFPNEQEQTIEKAIFRCYCSIPDFSVAPSAMKKRNVEGDLTDSGETPPAVKWSLVGAVDPALMENPDKPSEFDPDTDCLRKADMDINKSWQELKQDCAVM